VPRLKESWAQIISMIMGAILAIVGSAWANGTRSGAQEERVQSLEMRTTRIEQRQETIEREIIGKLDDLRVLVEHYATEEQVYHRPTK
jgi:hypothetical protein